nr:hypothetical protein [uncultured bacterium]
MSDLDHIKHIEQELGIKLESIDETDPSPRGYIVNQNEHVTGLMLRNCKIKVLDHIISPLSALPNLTQLDISSNQLSDLTPLYKLPNLTLLNVGTNQLSDITPLSALSNLIELRLSSNQLNDISPLVSLTRLTKLHLEYLPLRDISSLKDLQELRYLNLLKCNISDISPLKNLEKLNRLSLHYNPISELPFWITDFDMEIRWGKYGRDGYITFYDNPLKNPPPEIIKQGKEAIKNYFTQMEEQEEDYLFEAKMLIVGEPGAGKTTLAWKMQDAECALPKEEETTRGIEVKPYYFPLQPQDFAAFPHQEKLVDHNFRLNLWDFGGQEIYKATHRFFLSKRSLYTLVADSRNEDADFNYWLHIVEMFGGDSPLLIVLNEKHQRKRNLDASAMRARFDNISQVLDVDFAEADNSRLKKLQQAIKYYVSQLPNIGNPVPAKWTVVREALEQDERATITLQDYLTICKNTGIAKPQDALVLSQYFHDIGVFLHFQEDDLLNRTIFLKPNWATNAVYKILDHPLLNQQQGRFNKDDAHTIWCEEEYALLCNELLRLMQKFFLTYEIDHSGEYIVPERLPAAQPDYPWNDQDNLVLRYAYDLFMPRGILSQFIVSMHRYIRNHDYVWLRGVVLERDKTIAEVLESYDARTIKIRISGPQRRDFMTLITEQLDQINGQYERMVVDKLIPCNCAECQASSNAYFFEYKKLKRRIEKGRQEIECEHSFDMVNVRSLIDDVINVDLRRSGTMEDMSEQKSRHTLHRRIVDLLTSLPAFAESSGRQALLISAGLDAQLKTQIDVNQPPTQFFSLMVSALSVYGTLKDGRNALTAILETTKGYVGQEKQALCDALIEEIEH